VSSDDKIGAQGKGLRAGAVGLLGATVIGIASVAPGYTLTAALGPTVAAVGIHAPAVILVGFLPMLLVAFGYRELNRAMPDNGTSFTWVTRAFGPCVGWLAGWGLVISTVLVLSNAAGIAVDFFYLGLAQLTGDSGLAALPRNVPVNLATCFAFMAAATWISYRGMKTTQAVQYILVGVQVAVLVAFAGFALYRAANGQGPDPTPVRFAWFNPLEIPSFTALAAGLSLSIFIFWGWDVTLTLNEETRGARTTPGVAATFTVVTTVLLYLLISVASISFAGVGDTGIGLNNPDVQANVFFAMARPVFGALAIAVSLAVLISSLASLQSTITQPSRTLLAMAFYKALPAPLATVSRRYETPVAGIVASTAVSWIFYAVMTVVSVNVLSDTVTALGILICFYYSLTAFACVWYFRRQCLDSVTNFFMQLVCPLVGGLILAALFFKTTIDSMDPAYGSGSHIGNLGLVFIVGMGLIALGAAIMLALALAKPAFFRGDVVSTGAAEDERSAA
jgi:amino acid transporter